MAKWQKNDDKLLKEEVAKEIERCSEYVYKLEDAVMCGMGKRAIKIIEGEHDAVVETMRET